MTRTRLPLLVILSVAIAVSTLLLDASIPVQACPLTDGSATSGDARRQPDAANHLSDVTRLPGDSERRSSFDYMDWLSLGAVAGLFTIALFCKARYSRSVAPTEVEFLNRHPQFEHPEMTLAFIPQEALLSTFNTEFVSTR